MSRAKAFARHRDAMLRSLSEAAYDKFARKWGVAQPAQWHPGAKLAAMHKARANLSTFTEEEQEQSRAWLAANGFTDAVGGQRDCPDCGHMGPSFSSCPTCGMAQ